MLPSEYIAALPDALTMHRHGHGIPTIIRRFGGTEAWWHALFTAASEYPSDPRREEIMDMRGSGRSVASIAEILEMPISAVRAALADEEREPTWDDEMLVEMVADWENGLTVPRIARKYGWRSSRVARNCLERVLRRWRKI